jgi:cobalamin biosynthesis protein CobW
MNKQKIPATVITGFLGAGKTTLIRNLLTQSNGRRLALIINEFGDVGVDGEILKGCGDSTCSEDDVIELANGCICCTVADDFVPTMKKLIERPDPPQHIIIETSGLALPQPLVRAFNWPDIKPHLTVDSVVTVVDAKALSEGRFADDEDALAEQRAADPTLDHENPIEELFEDQLNCADIVILNKIDLLSEVELSMVNDLLRPMLRQGSRLVQVGNGDAGAEILIGSKSAAEDDMANRLSHHEMEGEEQHDHDDFMTFVVSLGELPDKATLLARIETAIKRHDILRLKGFAAISGQPSRLLIQAAGPRLNSYFDRPWRSGEPRVGTLVVIGERHMDRDAIASLLLG